MHSSPDQAKPLASRRSSLRHTRSSQAPSPIPTSQRRTYGRTCRTHAISPCRSETGSRSFGSCRPTNCSSMHSDYPRTSMPASDWHSSGTESKAAWRRKSRRRSGVSHALFQATSISVRLLIKSWPLISPDCKSQRLGTSTIWQIDISYSLRHVTNYHSS